MKSIDNVGIHQATGIIVVTLGEWFAIESFHQPNTLRLIAADRFKVMWRVKRYQKPPLQLPNADMELFRAEKDWPSKFDAVFRRRLNAEPEDWKW